MRLIVKPSANKSVGNRKQMSVPMLRFPFLFRDLDERLLGPILFWVKRVTVDAIGSNLFTSESVGKLKMRVYPSSILRFLAPRP